MPYDIPPRPRASGGLIVVVLLMGFLVAGLAAAAAFAFMLFARAESRQAQVAMQREVAVRNEARARVEHLRGAAERVGRKEVVDASAATIGERSVAESMPEMPALPDGRIGVGGTGVESTIRVADREVRIQLDETGKIQVDGAVCELPQLKDLLAKAGAGRENAIIVFVQADKRCLFEPVAAVLAVCRELQLPHVRISALAD